MNILQRILDGVSPKSLDEERRKTQEYEERRGRRLARVRGATGTEERPPDADDLGAWFGVGGRGNGGA